jgi:hypothetical protein
MTSLILIKVNIITVINIEASLASGAARPAAESGDSGETRIGPWRPAQAGSARRHGTTFGPLRPGPRRGEATPVTPDRAPGRGPDRSGPRNFYTQIRK